MKAPVEICLLIFDDGLSFKIERASFDGLKLNQLCQEYNGEEGAGPYYVQNIEVEGVPEKAANTCPNYHIELKRRNRPICPYCGEKLSGG